MASTSSPLQLAHRVRAQAEFEEWNAMVATDRAERARIANADWSAMRKRMAVTAIALEIAHELGMSEHAVHEIVRHGSVVQHSVPSAWLSFARGDIDAYRARLIGQAALALRTPEALEVLDAKVVGYATSHTAAELRTWLKRLVARLEPDEFDRRAEAAREQRDVTIVHVDDAMSWVNAYVPTVVAVAAAHRLEAAVAAQDDDRTDAQKRADLVAHWLTTATGTETHVCAEIAVVVDADVLAGYTAGVATVDDEPVPVAWVRDLIASGDTLWTRLLTDPAGDILDVTQISYQPSRRLRHAIRWRDGTCRVWGCRTKASRCDLDHAVPFDSGGPTTAANLHSLCRKHHGIKGHGLLPAGAVRAA